MPFYHNSVFRNQRFYQIFYKGDEKLKGDVLMKSDEDAEGDLDGIVLFQLQVRLHQIHRGGGKGKK